MAIINRKLIYKDKIAVSYHDLLLARRGKKRCTIRLGIAEHVDNQLLLVSNNNEEVKIKITRVDTSKSFSDLSEEHARLEGFETKTELFQDLRKYYGDIDPKQPITVIFFEIL